MTPRDFGPPTHAPREHFAAPAGGRRSAWPSSSAPSASAWPTTTSGAATPASHPDPPGYGSLNLAQAVQLMAYEWRQALGGFAVQPRTAGPRWPPPPAVQGLLAHWREVLVQIGFLDPAAPKKLMPRLQPAAATAPQPTPRRCTSCAASRGPWPRRSRASRPALPPNAPAAALPGRLH
jgi:tRNA/rRNA methyltransferase